VSQNIPFAIGLGLVGSFCFAMSAKLQHSAVGEQVEDNRTRQRMDRRQLWQLIKDRNWWIGLGFMGISLCCQVLGLTMAPVSVVQPVGLLAFPWSVALAGRPLGSRRRRILVPTALTVVAAFAFVVVVAANAAPAAELSLIPVMVGAGVVYGTAVIFVSLGTSGPRPWRCLFWASGGALFYGLEASLVKSLIQYASDHDWWKDPLVWGIGVALLVGSCLAAVLVQQGYATGPAVIVVASMTVTSPVVAVIFGIAVLGEGAGLTPAPAASLLLLGAAAVAGVVLLARVHPAYHHTREPENVPEEPNSVTGCPANGAVEPSAETVDPAG
jgi:hypothetical protein